MNLQLKIWAVTICGNLLDKLRKAYISWNNHRISKIVGGGIIAYPFDIRGVENISVHPTSSIGSGSCLFATRAKIVVKEHVITGPRVTIITGDHQYFPGRYLDSVKDGEKDAEYDADVIIERDVWIGANVTILKGVHIGQSAIIAAGAVVTRNIPDFAVAGGVPAKVIKYKWDEQTRQKHLNFLNEIEKISNSQKVVL
jgi:hypothetical protein